jgi:hypothetical protein
MNFEARKKMRLNKSLNVANEASQSDLTVNVDGQSMKIYIITDKIIEENNLKPVKDSVFFKRGAVPTEEGLLSPLIFGDSIEERKLTHAYIDLNRKFFHPYVFEVLSKLSKKFNKCAMGDGCWMIGPDGDLIEVTDRDSRDYNENNTGIAWLIDNYHKLTFKETDASIREERLKLLSSLTDDEIMISKYIVIPIFYRDVDTTTGKNTIPDINYMYADVLANVNSIDNEILSSVKHLTLYKIQSKLVELRKYGQSLIEKKKGAFQQSILGKAPDFGARGVISVPSLNGCDLPNDCIVDITHSGLPLHKCIELGYPFVIKWITEFFEDTFRNKTTMPVFRKNKKGEYQLDTVDIIDQTEIYTKEFIDKKLEMFRKSYGAERFETIKIRCVDGTDAEMVFTGRGYATRPDDPRANTISNRPMTWTDIVYLASENMLADKYCYITRYPLEDYFGTFPSQVAVLSTIKTSPVIINEKVYPHYPVIDLTLEPKEIATQFIDTISLSNLYLDAIGGD